MNNDNHINRLTKIYFISQSVQNNGIPIKHIQWLIAFALLPHTNHWYCRMIMIYYKTYILLFCAGGLQTCLFKVNQEPLTDDFLNYFANMA